LDVIEAMKTRRSIRGFKKDPVPREIIHKILEAAIHTPSGMNTQPWEFVVATGEALDRIREECGKLFNEGSFPTNDMLRNPYEGIYRQRQVELAMEIFKLMDIAREDKEARKKWMSRGFRFFGAPCQIVLCADKGLHYHLDMLSLGAVCQSICLAGYVHSRPGDRVRSGLAQTRGDTRFQTSGERYLHWLPRPGFPRQQAGDCQGTGG
jgi:nitroreductase